MKKSIRPAIDNDVNDWCRNNPDEVNRLNATNAISENSQEVSEEFLLSLIDKGSALTEKTLQYFAKQIR